MKPVKLFYLRSCPFCKKALRYIDEARAAHPELAAVGIELIEESEQPAVADAFDAFAASGADLYEDCVYDTVFSEEYGVAVKQVFYFE